MKTIKTLILAIVLAIVSGCGMTSKNIGVSVGTMISSGNVSCGVTLGD